MVHTVSAIYFALISLIAVILTAYDKSAAKRRPGRRIPEKTLITVGALGGAAAMYCEMKCIRYKTLHRKFMIGLPCIMLLQAAAVIAAHIFVF